MANSKRKPGNTGVRNRKPLSRNEVRSMIQSNIEVKTYAQTYTTASATAGAVIPCSYIAQNDTVNGRTGSIIRPRKFHIQIAAWDNTENFIRFIVFRDNQNNGTAPVVADVLNSAGYNSPYNYINVESGHRFQILDDIVISTSTNGPSAKYIQKTYLTKGTTVYTGTDAVEAHCGRGQYYVLTISAVASADQSVTTRLYYTDA
jgi:hypothetical protein